MTKLVLRLQLTAVGSVVFTVKAVDADGDTMTYTIDSSSVRTPHLDLHCQHPPDPDPRLSEKKKLTGRVTPAARRHLLQDRPPKQRTRGSGQTCGLREQNPAAGHHLG